MAAEVPDDGVAPSLPWPSPLPWQRSALLDLASAPERLPHALLIHGAAGIGKHAFALHLAQALLCEAPRADAAACGVCAGCRYAMAGQHPDLMRLELVTPEAESGELIRSETIPVERIRAMIDFVQLSSHRQGLKLGVVAPADRMNAAAVNALLKTLEEPPPRTHLILVADQPARLLATVRSRCRHVLAPRPDPAAAREWLLARGIADPDPVLAQAAGAPLAALMLADPVRQQERQVWLAALANPDALRPMQLAARIDAAGKDDRKARLAGGVEWLLAWTADLARVARGGAPSRNVDFGPAMVALAPRVAPPALFRYHRVLLRHRALLQHPLQPRLVAEALLLDYRALFQSRNAC